MHTTRQVPLKTLIRAYLPSGLVSALRGRGAGSGGGASQKPTGGAETLDARYCYCIWLRHLYLAKAAGMSLPHAVAELGPGGSIGTGLAALLSGADRYLGVDTVPLLVEDRAPAIFEELVELFERREPIPGPDEMPKVLPPLPSYGFPSDILTDDVLKKALDKGRLDVIRKQLANPTESDIPAGGPTLSYIAPWSALELGDELKFDMIFSQAVMMYVADLDQIYGLLFSALKAGGWMSHQISLSSVGATANWDGHWAIPDRVWKLMRKDRPYYISRLPHSAHTDSILRQGFKIATDRKIVEKPNFTTRQLAKEFRSLSEEDRSTRSAFILAVKPLD